jgi:hypothetical protein
LLSRRRPKKKKRAQKPPSSVKDTTSTEVPSAKEAEGEASTGGDAAPGVSVVAATPPSLRAPSPTALSKEEETEEAPAKETPIAKETLTVEEAPTAGSMPT